MVPRQRCREPRRTRRGGESGFALVAVITLSAVSLLIVLSVLTIGGMESGLVAKRVEKSRALYLAEGGLAQGLAWLEAQDEPPEGTAVVLPFGAAPDTAGSGIYAVRIVPDTLNPSAERPRYTICSSGTVEEQTRALELDVQVQTFTDFLYFTDLEHEPGIGGPLWFHTGDVIDGPLFTNDQISIMGNPIFRGVAISAFGGAGDKGNNNPLFLYYNNDRNNHIESSAPSNPPYDCPQFCDGYILGAPQIEYPTHVFTSDFRDLAREGGIALTGSYDFYLSRPDPVTGEPMYGTVSYSADGTDWTDVDLSTINGVIYVNGTFSVHGTLDGLLTLVTNGNIDITGDLLYRDSGPDGPGPYCDDMLGLLSGSDINVVDNAPNSDDCVICAAMMALDNSFRVDNWNTGDPRGTLTVYGSIVQGFRGSVGTSMFLNGEEVLLTGYLKNYHYDYRLLHDCPPFFNRFMQTGRYAKIGWREVTAG
jgi:hypothetical protein